MTNLMCLSHCHHQPCPPGTSGACANGAKTQVSSKRTSLESLVSSARRALCCQGNPDDDDNDDYYDDIDDYDVMFPSR